MSARVTAPDVRDMFQRTFRAAQSVGLDTHSWYLIPGSAANGRAWKLYSRPGGGDALTGLDRGDLGMTAREARETLRILAVAWETVAEHQGRIRDLTRRISMGEPGAYAEAMETLRNLGETNSG